MRLPYLSNEVAAASALQSPSADISAVYTSAGLKQLVGLLSAEQAEVAEAAGRLLARLCSTRPQVRGQKFFVRKHVCFPARSMGDAAWAT